MPNLPPESMRLFLISETDSIENPFSVLRKQDANYMLNWGDVALIKKYKFSLSNIGIARKLSYLWEKRIIGTLIYRWIFVRKTTWKTWRCWNFDTCLENWRRKHIVVRTLVFARSNNAWNLMMWHLWEQRQENDI